jgi:hypothetical protein
MKLADDMILSKKNVIEPPYLYSDDTHPYSQDLPSLAALHCQCTYATGFKDL